MVGHVTGNNIAKFYDQNHNKKKATIDLRNALQLTSFDQMPVDLKLFGRCIFPDSKVHGANMGPTCRLQMGPMLAP